MATLLASKIKDTYKSLLKMATSGNNGIDGTFISVEDGDATASTLQLSTAGVKSTGTFDVTGVSTLAAVSATTGTFSSTLGVTGASTLADINSSGVMTNTSTNGTPFRATGATTGNNVLRMSNTGGDAMFGIENSVGGNNLIVGATGYDAIVRGATGIAFSANAGSAMQMRLSSTGLAVAGTLGVTGATTLSSTLQSTNIGINYAPQTDRIFIYNGSGATNLITAQQDGTGDLIRLNGNSGANRFAITQAGAVTIPNTLGVTGVTTLTGNVGIGTAPAAPLHIEANANSSQKIFIKNTTSGTAAITGITLFNNSGVTGAFNAYSSAYTTSGPNVADGATLAGNAHLGLDAFGSSGYVAVYTGASELERMRITSAGKVGIGTVSPLAKLEIGGVKTTAPSATNKGIVQVSGLDNDVGLNMGNYISSPYAMWIQAMDNRTAQATTYPLTLNPIGGNVGIGTDAPASPLHIYKAASNSLIEDGLRVSRPAVVATFGYLSHDTGDITYLGSSYSGSGYGTLVFQQIDSANALTRNAMTISNTGAVTIASGQITFPAAQNASADANTLDDYEEGTWTPNIVGATSGSVTMTSTTSVYVKIGRQVTVYVNELTWTAKTTLVGNVLISGLPFTIASSRSIGALGVNNGGFSSVVIAAANVDFGNTYVYLINKATTNNTYTHMADANIDATGSIYGFTITYVI